MVFMPRPNSWSGRNPKTWMKALGRTCYLCGKHCRTPKELGIPKQENHPDRFTLDHVIPHSLGGTGTIENLRPCCYACNQERNKSFDAAFVKRQRACEAMGVKVRYA